MPLRNHTRRGDLLGHQERSRSPIRFMVGKPKPKVQIIRADVEKLSEEWDFFPAERRVQIARSIVSAINAYYRLKRPSLVDAKKLKKANLAPPLPQQRGRPSDGAVDFLVGRLAYIYGDIVGELGIRSWDGA